ncbi:hypothetical protein JZ751_025765 [Albula glossodonta]|uniref:Uncharacterized protein n=1 Tax=Albula glossodonta TaxID=121402 RepID=A0A8T2MQH2_9TELE|nr:hypothetical protein JZ751_025765 [Albula glossodonta]
MALEEVCGFRDTSVYPRWNTPASLFMLPEDTTLQSGGGLNLIGLHSAGADIPLQFYAPVPEYLTRSPLQFGQVSPSTGPSQASNLHPPFWPPLPRSSCLSGVFPLSSSSTSVPLPFPHSHGTTTLAFVFQGGVVAAADSRSSCKGLVACPASQKILPVHSHLVGTTSGTSADCALWKRILARELRLYQLRHRRRPSTGGAAKLLAHMLHPFKGTELCVAATLCGWDLAEGESEVGGGWELEEQGEVERGNDNSGVGEWKRLGEGAVESEEEALGRGGADEREGRGKAKEGSGGLEPKEDGLTAGVRKWQREKEEGRKKMEGAAQTSSSVVAEETSSKSAGPGARKEEQALSPAGCSGSALSTRGQHHQQQKRRRSGPSLHYVCSDGTRLQGVLFSVGSGSPYAYSVLDGGVQWGLGVAEACALARRAVYHATHRDAYSGNCVDLYHITARGWSRRKREDLREEYYRERERERERVEERRREGESERVGGRGGGRDREKAGGPKK